jgi:nucleotide-binding universal stress UspA family protein
MRILIPVDGSKYTDMCLKTAAFLCRSKEADEYVLLNVTHHISDIDLELVPRDRDAIRESFMKRAEALLEKSKDYLLSQGIRNVTTVILKGASPSQEIIEFAEKEKMNLIIIGARGASEQARFLLGAETPKVVKYSPCCVFVVKDTCMDFCTL